MLLMVLRSLNNNSIQRIALLGRIPSKHASKQCNRFKHYQKKPLPAAAPGVVVEDGVKAVLRAGQQAARLAGGRVRHPELQRASGGVGGAAAAADLRTTKEEKLSTISL